MNAHDQRASGEPGTTQDRPPADEDVQSDPHLDDPRDQQDAPGPEEGEEQADEGVSSDWTSEGGATPEGPATAESAAHEGGA